MRKKLSFALLCLVIGVVMQFISSCRQDPTVPTTPVCFDGDIYPIIATNCDKSGCHDKGERDFTSYDKIMSSGTVVAGNAQKSSFYKKITNRMSPMPPSPTSMLTDDQIRKIYIWILQGAKHTTCDSTATDICDSLNVTYSGTIKPIIDNYCATCHSGSNPPGGVLLQNYSELVSVINDGNFQTLVFNYTDNPMPPSGKLNTCKIAQLKKWIADGMPNN